MPDKAPESSGSDICTMLIEAGENTPGLDMRFALGLVNFNWEIWAETARSFVLSTPPLLEIITRELSGTENPGRFTVIVHGLKGACYSLGASGAGDMARELEQRSKSGDLNYVKDYLGNFLDTMANLIEILKGFLEKLPGEAEKPRKARPDSGVLLEILDAAHSYNIERLDRGIAALEKYSYDEEAELVSWLKEKSGVSDFRAIAERLAKLLN